LMVTDYSSRQTVLQRPSRFVTEVPPDLYEIWSLEEESVSTPALAAPATDDEEPGGGTEGGVGGEPGGYVN
jgi:hypothetical protein